MLVFSARPKLRLKKELVIEYHVIYVERTSLVILPAYNNLLMNDSKLVAKTIVNLVLCV
jgi:hypothetical protein